MKHILVVDDHVAVREGIVRLLSSEFPEAAILAVADESAVLNAAGSEAYDIVVLDLSLPGRGGLELIRQLKDLAPQCALLVYTVHSEDQFGVRALRCGADGYLTKDRPAEELIEAVRCLAAGRRYITSRMADRLAEHVASPSGLAPHESLSDREFEVLACLAGGATPTEIANQLNLSIKTISTYRARLLEKLSLHSTGDLIRYAIEKGVSKQK
ncbi:MAG: response regulator transcription factor [Candidatus Solibacter usitatus]|nr:response regulator transcription factor [Candidatus Solibacter usitatus]